MQRAQVSRTGRKENNQLRPEDRPVHDWYRFVLSFPPHLVRTYLQRFAVKNSAVVLDPFCGTGTTLVECQKLGFSSIGIEANPMAALASRVKVDWRPSPDHMIHHAQRVAEATTKAIAKSENGELRTLRDDTRKLLLTNSISPLPLHKTLMLLRLLQQHRDERFEAHENLALAKALVTSIGNLHFGPEVGVGPAKSDAQVESDWLAQVVNMVTDLRELSCKTSSSAQVHHGDARQLGLFLQPGTIDAVITSPPYPNEKDYTRTTRLESVLLGLIQTKQDLRALKQQMVRSNTRGVYKGDDDEQWIAGHGEIERIANEIEARRLELGKTSGFERLYARVTKLYFGGMARHLAELRPFLRRGGQLAYVVGDQASYLRIMIRTGQLLADIALSLGYRVVSIDLFRTRRATATRAQLREEVVVLRWDG